MSALSVLTVLVVIGVAGCGAQGPGHPDGPTSSPPTPPILLLDFEVGLDVGSSATRVENAGSGDVVVRPSGPGRVEVVDGPDGGHAVRFPAYTGAAGAAAAVLVVSDPTGSDLDPGNADFSFGADFQLDETSSGSAADNGDNLVQRGTFDSPGQFKIQLDHDVPSCRVLGDAGEVFVKADGPVDPGSWYTVTCRRTAADVVLTVKAQGGGSGGGTWRASGSTGRISLQGLPLTIGGKTAPDGKPVASPDQFNGAVDNVFLSMG